MFTPVATELRVQVASDRDILSARQRGRELAHRVGFGPTDQAIVATAISELARNIIQYALRGEIQICAIEDGNARGIMVAASDEGPGIASVDQAMQDGYSTSGGLGLGLPGVKRLMDDFEIVSKPGVGTTVTVRKWSR